MLHFDFLEKCLRIVSPQHFVYDYSKKMFLMLYSIHSIHSIHLLLQIMGNMCIAIVSFPGFDVIKFEINLIFLIKPFFYLTKNSRQKFKYLEKKRAFNVK